MEEMKAIQPEMAALREKFRRTPETEPGDDALYKEHKVNPLELSSHAPAASLLRGALQRAERLHELRQASFIPSGSRTFGL